MQPARGQAEQDDQEGAEPATYGFSLVFFASNPSTPSTHPFREFPRHENRLEAFSDGVLAHIVALYIAVAVLWIVPDADRAGQGELEPQPRTGNTLSIPGNRTRVQERKPTGLSLHRSSPWIQILPGTLDPQGRAGIPAGGRDSRADKGRRNPILPPARGPPALRPVGC